MYTSPEASETNPLDSGMLAHVLRNANGHFLKTKENARLRSAQVFRQPGGPVEIGQRLKARAIDANDCGGAPSLGGGERLAQLHKHLVELLHGRLGRHRRPAACKEIGNKCIE
eukprot:3294494-Pleurochrysis_carterae.AAC.2